MTTNTRTTSDYSKFSLLIDNRGTARTHVNRLKDAINANPAILEVQPILVNEKMEIIDGQHRFMAASELGLPISYNVVKGIGIETAREMNVLQRSWNINDYAMSFAKAGNVNYKAYNKYRQENPGLSSTVVMTVLRGNDSNTMSMDFRTGKFVIGRDIADAEFIFDQLSKTRELTGGEIPLSKSYVVSYIKALDNTDFDNEVFMRHLASKPEMFHRTMVVKDGLRMIEDIFNYSMSTNTIRLY